MVVPRKVVPALLVLLAFVLAGCSGGGGGTEGTGAGPGDEAPKVEATATTGGIRGVVVDERIVPVKGAFIEVLSTTKNATTGEDGLFAISGLDAGTYFIRVSHGLYASAQQSADVVAGEEDPASLRIQLVRTVLEDPYYYTLQFDGYIVCSTNVGAPLFGYLLSEECGEGAGVPDEECVPVTGPCQAIPPPGGSRVGGQSQNNVQFDFSVENTGIKAIIVEQTWQATSEAGKGLYSPVSTDWSCLPSCSGNTFFTLDGESPTYGYINETKWKEYGDDKKDLNLTPETTISVFTWASPAGTTGASMTLNQQYQMFVTLFYYLPPPEGWSFINSSPSPY